MTDTNPIIQLGNQNTGPIQVPQQNKAAKPVVKVDKGFIYIGNQSYRVTVGGRQVVSPDFLAKLKNLLETQVSEDNRNQIIDSSKTVTLSSQGMELEGKTLGQDAASFAKFVNFAKSYHEIHTNLSRMLMTKGFQTNEVRTAIYDIIEEPALFNDVPGKSPWSERTLMHSLFTPGNEALRAALFELRQSFKGRIDLKPFWKPLGTIKAEQDVRHFIMNNMIRTPRLLETKDQSFIQRFTTSAGGIPDNGVFDIDKAIPSTADKRTDANVQNKNLNLGSVVVQDEKKTTCLVTRSGKSNTAERLQEAVMHAAMEHLKSDGTGFVKNAKGGYEFTHHITSHLDALNSCCASEPKELKKILGFIDEWPQEGISVKLKVPKSDKPNEIEEITVILKRPILSSTMFSANSPVVSDRLNFFSTLELFSRSGKLEDLGDDFIHLAQKAGFQGTDPSLALEFLLQKKSKLSFAKSDHFFKSQEMQRFKTTFGLVVMGKSVKSEALRALMLTQEPPLSSLDKEIYRNLLLRELGISSGKQCGRGTDRTSAGVALAIAQESFKKQMGKDFIPGKVQGEELLAFKKVYRDALNEFGLAISSEATGYCGMKLQYTSYCFRDKPVNPGMFQYLFTEEDVKKIAEEKDKKKYEGYPQKADIVKGKMVEFDRLDEFQKNIKRWEKTHTGQLQQGKDTPLTTILNFLKSTCGLSESNIQFEAGHELLTHIKDLELDRKAPHSTKSRIELIEEKIKTLGDSVEKNKDDKSEEGRNLVLQLRLLKTVANAHHEYVAAQFAQDKANAIERTAVLNKIKSL